jgi:VanZ family protein
MDSPGVLIGKKRASGVVIQKVSLQVAWRWLAVILWMAMIFALSATPSIATPLEPVYDFTFKKLAHITVYAILTILLFRALRLHITNKGHAVVIAVLLAILYALSDEWHQTFVPGREGTLRDVGIDAIGAVGMYMWLRIKSQRAI